MTEDFTKLLAGLSQQVGEVRGEVRQILGKLDMMERKYNGYTGKTIRMEEKIEEVRGRLDDHLSEHDHERGWKVQTRAAVYGGIAGSAVGFFLTLCLILFSQGF